MHLCTYDADEMSWDGMGWDGSEMGPITVCAALLFSFLVVDLIANIYRYRYR